VFDNMAFGLRRRKVEEAEVKRKVGETAEILGLTGYLQRRPRELSGGERQRVALGRAMVRKPQVFLFDEPLSNLDAKLRVQMRTEIKELHQRLRTTSIYVTHDQIEAMTMADKIVVLKDGIVEQIGTPLELYDRPANTFVAGFIGSPAMNFLPGTFRSNGGSTVEFQGGIRVPAPANADGKDGQQVLYGIRPEHFALTDSGGMHGDIVVVEPTGADTQVFCKIAGQEVMAMFRDRVQSQPGERIALMPDLSKAHLFDAKSGARLAA